MDMSHTPTMFYMETVSSPVTIGAEDIPPVPHNGKIYQITRG